jgi:hypothetical protein
MTHKPIPLYTFAQAASLFHTTIEQIEKLTARKRGTPSQRQRGKRVIVKRWRMNHRGEEIFVIGRDDLLRARWHGVLKEA